MDGLTGQSAGVAQDQGSAAPATEATSNTVTEKMIPQSKVNDIIRERLSEKESRLRSEFEAEKAKFQQPHQATQTQNMGGMQQYSQEQLRAMVAEETKRQQDRLAQEYLEHIDLQQAQKTVSEVLSKFEAAKKDYPDFEQKVTALQLDKIPALVKLANGTDNTADVMYELAENPHKIANILQFANNPNTEHLAQMAMQRLSASIKQNKQAATAPTANDPLSHIKPSVTGTDNGKKGVRDLRRESWMRA